MMKSSKLLHFIAKAAVTLAMFRLIMRNISLNHWQAMLSGQNWALLSIVVIFMVFQMLLVSWRWKTVLGIVDPEISHRLSFFYILRIYYIGLFFNTCLPGTIGGDAIRVWLTRSDHVPLTLAAHSVIIDRLLGLLALLILITVMLLPLGKIAGFNALPLLLAIPATGAAGLWLLFKSDTAMEKWRHRHVIGRLLYLAGNLRLLLKHPGLFCVLLASSLAVHLLYCLNAYTIAHSLGIHLGILLCLILVPPVPLAAVLPISIGGWGVREAGMVTMLALAGIPKAAALMLSIQLGLITILVNLPGGLLWLAHTSARQSVRLPQKS